MCRKIILILLLLLEILSVQAQGDTIMVGYSPENPAQCWINEMTPLKHGKTAFIKLQSPETYAYIVDKVGAVLHSTALGTIDGFTVKYCNYIFDDSDHLVFVGNAEKNGDYYWVSIETDTLLEHISIRDSLLLGGGVRAAFLTARYNPHKLLWEAFGTVHPQTGNNAILENCYLALDTNFHFQKYQILTGTIFRNYILEFFWHEPSKRYVVPTFIHHVLLVNEEMQVLEDASLSTFVSLNGIICQKIYDIYGTDIRPDGSPLCYAIELLDTTAKKLAFVTLEILADTIILKEIHGFNDPFLPIVENSHMRVDQDGNYIIVGNNGTSFGQSNKIYVMKVSPDFERIWDITWYDAGRGYNIGDLEIDSENNILITGMGFNMFGTGTINGFLLKVYSDGTLVSTATPVPEPSSPLLLYPNPSAGVLCIGNTEEMPEYMRIWNSTGQIILQHAITEQCTVLDMIKTSGLYWVELWYPGGQKTVRPVSVILSE